ncbi:hypothetical protein OAS39_08175 [Pirellulales bacterium]|nr:hypothetical protein [Pirellulales bacterium]
MVAGTWSNLFRFRHPLFHGLGRLTAERLGSRSLVLGRRGVLNAIGNSVVLAHKVLFALAMECTSAQKQGSEERRNGLSSKPNPEREGDLDDEVGCVERPPRMEWAAQWLCPSAPDGTAGVESDPRNAPRFR